MAEVDVTFVKVPQAEPEHPGPLAVHRTPLFVGSLAALAVKTWVWPWSMFIGLTGLIPTTTSVDGALLPQPHVNTRIETANASFFIIDAFPLP